MLKLLHCFHDERLLFYVMPLVQGTTVGALMAGQPFKFIPEPWAKHYTLQTISALRYLHCKGIVHRNIYPDSMLVHSDGWLVLGGTMLMRQPRKDARLWTVCGVPDYLAPETIQGFGQSRMTDMWSLGILIHEMMTSKVPFDGEDPLDAMRRILLNESEIIVQGNAVDLVTKLLHPKPSDRLGFSGGRSPASVRDAFAQVRLSPFRTRPAEETAQPLRLCCLRTGDGARVVLWHERGGGAGWGRRDAALAALMAPGPDARADGGGPALVHALQVPLGSHPHARGAGLL